MAKNLSNNAFSFLRLLLMVSGTGYFFIHSPKSQREEFAFRKYFPYVREGEESLFTHLRSSLRVFTVVFSSGSIPGIIPCFRMKNNDEVRKSAECISDQKVTVINLLEYRIEKLIGQKSPELVLKCICNID